MKKTILLLMMLISTLIYSQKPKVDAVRYSKITTVERNLLSPELTNIWFIYNTTNQQFEYYNGVSWTAVDTNTQLTKTEIEALNIDAESIGGLLPSDFLRDYGSLTSTFIPSWDGTKLINSDLNFEVSGSGQKVLKVNAGYINLYWNSSNSLQGDPGLFLYKDTTWIGGLMFDNDVATNDLSLWHNDGGKIKVGSNIQSDVLIVNSDVVDGGIDVKGDVNATGDLITDKAIIIGTNSSFVVDNNKITIRKQFNHGLILKGATGSVNDFALATIGGQLVLVNPTGTNDLIANLSIGNFGVGKTPTEKLDVLGNIKASGSGTFGGNVTATNLIGNGSQITNVDAVTLDNLDSSDLARYTTVTTFSDDYIYPLSSSDISGKYLIFDNTVAKTLTIQNDATFDAPIGYTIFVTKKDTGTLTLAFASPITVINNTGTYVDTGEMKKLVKIGANEWLVSHQ